MNYCNWLSKYKRSKSGSGVVERANVIAIRIAQQREQQKLQDFIINDW